MKKKVLFTMIAVALSMVAFGALTALAGTYGDLTYTITNNKITITDCNTSAVGVAGKLEIPKTIGGKTVTAIGDRAFSDCDGLISVIIPNSVTTIEEWAFSDCDGLTSITIPSSVTTIGDCAFFGCDCLRRVNITDLRAWCGIDFSQLHGNPLYSGGSNLYLNGTLITDCTIPDGTTTIGNYAFYWCSGLTSVTIPNSVTTIGDRAFSGCDGLISVIIPNSVTTIGKGAFSDCDGLTSITIPSSVTTMGDLVFSGCDALMSVTIGKGIEMITENAFSDCDELKYVCLPADVKYIRTGAFEGCYALETVFYAGSASQWSQILVYNKNENLTNANFVYNAVKKTYKFVTNCDVSLPDITDYAVYTAPVLKKTGKTLSGWYDNIALRGNPVTFPYYGSAKTLYAAWTDRTGTSFDDAFVASKNQEYTVSITESGQLVYFAFVPDASKEYRFYTKGSKDTYGYLYNSNMSQIASNDNGGDGYNFYISYGLTAGKTYYIAVKLDYGTGNFTLVTEEPADYRINSITIKDVSGNAISAIPQGTFLTTVSVTNVASNADAFIVLAKYAVSGGFKGLMYIQTEDVPTGSTIKLSIPVDNEDGDIVKLKAFCWASFGSLSPLGNSVSFPAE